MLFLSRKFLGGFQWFFCNLECFCNLVRCLQIFVRIILQSELLLQKILQEFGLLCIFSILYPHFLFINVRKCVQIVCKEKFAIMCKIICDYVQKLFFQNTQHSFILHFSPFPFSCYCGYSFANYLDLKIYFLKGIVELERYEAWNLALQINDVTLSNVVTRRSAEPRIQWSHLFLGFS